MNRFLFSIKKVACRLNTVLHSELFDYCTVSLLYIIQCNDSNICLNLFWVLVTKVGVSMSLRYTLDFKGTIFILVCRTKTKKLQIPSTNSQKQTSFSYRITIFIGKSMVT